MDEKNDVAHTRIVSELHQRLNSCRFSNSTVTGDGRDLTCRVHMKQLRLNQHADDGRVSLIPHKLHKWTCLYFLLVGVPVLSIAIILAAGSTLQPKAVSAPAVEFVGSTASGMSLLLLLLQIAVIVAAARGAGRILRTLGQPQVIGEMAAGILLGPSLLGAVAPNLWSKLFNSQSVIYLNPLSQVGVVLFMFVVGLEVKPADIRKYQHTAILTSHSSITAPFLFGVLSAWLLYPTLAGEGIPFPQFALFLGAAMSVTAFPVLARILAEGNLLASGIGVVALTCAAVDDATAWCILAAVAAIVRTGHGHSLWFTVLGTVGFVLFMMTIGRRLLESVCTRYVAGDGKITRDMTAFAILFALGGACITEWLGVHALFGAFVVGVAMPKQMTITKALLGRIEEILMVLLLPLFFAFTGFRTQLSLINEPSLWVICGVIVLMAIIGKLGGSAVASRLSGLTWRESASIGVLMNTRGLVELVFLNLGLELGVLSPTLFAMLVLMALTTTIMTTPLLSWTWPQPHFESVFHVGVMADGRHEYRNSKNVETPDDCSP